MQKCPMTRARVQRMRALVYIALILKTALKPTERCEFDRSEVPKGWRWLQIDVETQYVRRCCDRYFDTLRECVEDAVKHGYVVPVKGR